MRGRVLPLGLGRCPRPWWRISAVALLTALAVWLGGLAWFLALASRTPPLPPSADGIVALTGGAGRIEGALHLLAEGRARILLVSGVGNGFEIATLAHRAGLDPEPLIDRVTLGRMAVSTRGNARETAEWAERNHIRTLVVVTSAYHMPRALVELGRTMPTVRLLPWPAPLPGAEARSPPSLRQLIEEYNKYIVVASGLSSLLPLRETVRDAARQGRRA